MTTGGRAGPAGWTLAMLCAGCGQTMAQVESPSTRFEGAAGLSLRHGPAFPGSSDLGLKLTPAGFLRVGRITLTGSGGFTTRAAEDVERGLAAELARRGKLRISLGLRFDPGRSESDSAELSGMGDIRSTLRARWSARWDPNADWRLVAGISADLLGKGAGVLGDVGVSRRWSWGQGESVALGLALSGADQRYLQNWHGVTAAQSASARLAAFEPSAGLRDLQVTAVWRTEFQASGQGFGAFVGAGHTRLLGSAAESPLTRRRAYSTASGAVVWRF